MNDESQQVEASHPLAGTACLVLAVVVVVLAFVDGQGDLPFRMPRSWYINRSIWYFIGLMFFGAGWSLLRGRDAHRATAASAGDETTGSPRERRLFNRVILYTRADCHLCDQAKDTLLAYQAELPEIEEVDVDQNPQLTQDYGTCVPVVEFDGKVRFRGHVSEALLRRLLDGTEQDGGGAS